MRTQVISNPLKEKENQKMIAENSGSSIKVLTMKQTKIGLRNLVGIVVTARNPDDIHLVMNLTGKNGTKDTRDHRSDPYRDDDYGELEDGEFGEDGERR
ncbi:hypothetical protein L6164_035509 [Bauhinia variegata]|uniref:Uncharacterized protein n=1 Tax=Bauhinia variegata TaxID=167791 RepID=A0ACB9KE64_BAUVA|nr:hypothetical protein L6164_035509 [Bauhinia variegata]